MGLVEMLDQPHAVFLQRNLAPLARYAIKKLPLTRPIEIETVVSPTIVHPPSSFGTNAREVSTVPDVIQQRQVVSGIHKTIQKQPLKARCAVHRQLTTRLNLLPATKASKLPWHGLPCRLFGDSLRTWERRSSSLALNAHHLNTAGLVLLRRVRIRRICRLLNTLARLWNRRECRSLHSATCIRNLHITIRINNQVNRAPSLQSGPTSSISKRILRPGNPAIRNPQPMLPNKPANLLYYVSKVSLLWAPNALQVVQNKLTITPKLSKVIAPLQTTLNNRL